MQTLSTIEAEFGRFPRTPRDTTIPGIIAIDLHDRDRATLDLWIGKTTLALNTTTSGCPATRPEDTANVILRFTPPSD